MKEFYITSDYQQIHAKLEMPEGAPPERSGEKCPLAIMIHGFTGHMEEKHLIAICESIRKVGIATLRVDMYGHGKSSGSFKEHTLLKWIEGGLEVIHFAKKLDFVTDLYLLGHSQGGLMAMLLAGMMPDDLKALIPLAPAWMIPDAARAGNLAAAEFDPDHIPDELVIWGGKILGGDYARTAQLIHPEDMIAKYHGPVMIIQGSGDALVPMAYAEKAAELYENSELVVIPDDTHGFDLHLDQVTSAVEDFLMELK